MARRTVVTLIDDLDGSEAAESVSFAHRGVEYSIDLNEKNAAAFDKAVSKYVAHATRQSSRRPQAQSAAAASSAPRRTDLADVRAWAAKNGYEVAARGRIPSNVLDAYDNR